MALNPKGLEFTAGIARDITVAALNSGDKPYIYDEENVSKFFETIYRKVEELVVNNKFDA